MRARDLDEAIAWQNAVDYGLTAGLQSTDPAEQERWIGAVEAGNLYVNRTMTGAIVGRQPFGGWKRSAWGPTAKAGGPHYLSALTRWCEPDPAAGADYRACAKRLLTPVEMAGLRVETNQLRHHPLPGVIVRAALDVGDDQLARARHAAGAVGAPVEVSRPDSETVAELAARLDGTRRLRILGDPEPELLAAAAERGAAVLVAPVLSCASVELPRWLREQSVSRSRHRYGNIVL